MNTAAFSQLLLLGALWGAAFMFMRVAVPEFGAFSMAAARVGLACLIMLVIVAAFRQTLALGRRWKTYLAVGAVNTAIPFIAYSFAAQHIPAGYSAIANSTTPVWSALIAWLWFKQRLGVLKWLGIAFAFAGVLVLVGLQPVALTPLAVVGMLAAALAASMYATAGFLIKHYLTDDGPDAEVSQVASATGMVLGATVWLLLPGIALAPATMPSVKAWGAVLALSVFCTVAGYVLFFHLIKTVGPQRASSVAFLFPAFAAFWGWLVLGEPITFNVIAGMACVLFGTALVSMSGTRQGPTTAWERLRDHVLLPMAFALSPMFIRRRLVAWIRGNPEVFRLESTALLAGVRDRMPAAAAEAAAADLRFTRVADYADLWASLTRSDRWMAKHLRVDAPTTLATPALFVTFHYGGGWWLTRYLRTLGLPISIVMQRGPDAANWSQRILLWFGTLRMKTIERVCGAPLIYTDWGHASRGARGVLKAWKDGTSVLALIDLPPPLVDRSAAVQFLGATAYFPPSLIELAHRQQRPIHVFIGQWNRDTLQPELKVVSLNASSAEASLQAAVTLLEGAVQQRPGAWHGWGDVGLYFQRPAG